MVLAGPVDPHVALEQAEEEGWGCAGSWSRLATGTCSLTRENWNWGSEQVAAVTPLVFALSVLVRMVG